MLASSLVEQKFVTMETEKKVFANDDIKVITDRNLPDLVRVWQESNKNKENTPIN